ncbi:hypothetical protein BDV36DRAFT_244395, partial [Aspergillus pseudocaelatus]
MTYPSDKLPAMSGIAKEYAKVLGNAYVAGLWREFLVDELAWLPWEQCTAASEYRAPSWSWASVDGPVGRPFNAIEQLKTVHGANEGFPMRFDTMGTKSPDLVFSLIVTPASDVNETWKRIGAFFAKGSQIGPRDTLTRKSTITL